MFSQMLLLLLLLWSVGMVLQHLLPKQMSALRLSLARQCAAAWPRLAQVLKPKAQSGCAGGCHCPAANNTTNHKIDSSPMSHNNYSNHAKDSNHQQNTVAVADDTAANHVTHAQKIAATEQPIRWRNPA